MTKARIFFDDFASYAAATITAGTEDADLPVENIVHPHRGKVYRTGATVADESIVIDLGSAKAVRAVIILDHTLTGADSGISLQGNTADSWGAPIVDEAITYHAGTMMLILPAVQTYRYWRVIFTKSASSETRDIGRVFLGAMYECEKQVDFGALEVEEIDLSETDRSVGGQTYSEVIDSYWRIKADFSYITQTQKNIFDAVDAACGTHTPFFVQFSPDVLPYESLFYAKSEKLQSRKVEILRNGSYLWSTSMVLAEEI